MGYRTAKGFAFIATAAAAGMLSTFALSAAATAMTPNTHDDVPDDARINLRILYAGDPSHARTEDFVSFLSQHFAAVQATSYQTFKASEADGFDVVILDWPSIYPRDAEGAIVHDNFTLKTPTRPQLPEDWSRPTLLIGAGGQMAAEGLRSKFDWL